jgi:hypothetical protein
MVAANRKTASRQKQLRRDLLALYTQRQVRRPTHPLTVNAPADGRRLRGRLRTGGAGRDPSRTSRLCRC